MIKYNDGIHTRFIRYSESKFTYKIILSFIPSMDNVKVKFIKKDKDSTIFSIPTIYDYESSEFNIIEDEFCNDEQSVKLYYKDKSIIEDLFINIINDISFILFMYKEYGILLLSEDNLKNNIWDSNPKIDDLDNWIIQLYQSSQIVLYEKEDGDLYVLKMINRYEFFN